MLRLLNAGLTLLHEIVCLINFGVFYLTSFIVINFIGETNKQHLAVSPIFAVRGKIGIPRI